MDLAKIQPDIEVLEIALPIPGRTCWIPEFPRERKEVASMLTPTSCSLLVQFWPGMPPPLSSA